MAVPTITSATPGAGPAAGGDLVRVTGTDFAATVEVLFDGVLATVESLRDEAGVGIADVRTPAHADGSVDVTVRNLDAGGVPVPPVMSATPAWSQARASPRATRLAAGSRNSSSACPGVAMAIAPRRPSRSARAAGSGPR